MLKSLKELEMGLEFPKKYKMACFKTSLYIQQLLNFN